MILSAFIALVQYLILMRSWLWSASGAHAQDNPAVFHLNGLDSMRRGVTGRSERTKHREKERERGERVGLGEAVITPAHWGTL